MVKLISIALSALIFIQSFQVDLGDLVQFDELIEHAQFHNTEYGDSFMVFIAKHYGDSKTEHNKRHQEEQQDHEQLPFQHNSLIVGFSAFVLNDARVQIDNELTLDQRRASFFYQLQDYECYKSGILQPPQQA